MLSRLATAGMKLKSDKYSLLLQEVEYLGHKISAMGLKPTTVKVQTIVQAPQPTNVTQLKLFLGMLNYYVKFLSSLLTCLTPLYSLEIGT